MMCQQSGGGKEVGYCRITCLEIGIDKQQKESRQEGKQTKKRSICKFQALFIFWPGKWTAFHTLMKDLRISAGVILKNVWSKYRTL